MRTQIIYKNKEAKEKEGLIEKINCLMEIACDNLCILFSTEDSTNKPDYKNNYDEMYEKQGFYANLKIENGMLPSPWPDEITCIMSILRQSNHFIWLSKRICESEDIHFAWIYAHELQHLKQSLNNPYLLIVTKLLERDIPELDIPSEFDCERKAKQIVVNIFGEDKCHSYLREMMVGSINSEKRYSKLLELDIAADFDVEHEVKKAICIKKERMKNIQKEWQDNGSTNWNINIDKLCSCRDPHEAIISAVRRLPRRGEVH